VRSGATAVAHNGSQARPKVERIGGCDLRRSPKLTVTDIANRAKVSTSTVSLVLRNSPLVAEGTRQGVQRIIDKLGYVRDRGAGSLRSGTSQTIGLVLCEIVNPFYSELIAGIDAVLDRNGRIAFIGHSAEDPARQDRLIHRLREQNVDGIILSAAEGTDPNTISQLKLWNVPCVQTLRHVGQARSDYVGPAIAAGVEAAVEYLVREGHQRIAYIGAARQTSPTRERLAGFRAAINRHRLPEGRIVRCAPTREEGARAVRALLEVDNPPTAAVCYNDVCAFGVIMGLEEIGRRPRRDFGVVGFDNIADAALVRPALTTIAIDPRRIGEEAASLLLRRIADPRGRHERIIMPSRLIVRDT
jgi:LacI family transcriptional regulator